MCSKPSWHGPSPASCTAGVSGQPWRGRRPDLSGHRLLLDVGGGWGAHCIGAALHWPHLHAIVFEMAPVCEVAQEYIARHHLQERNRTVVGDLWQDRSRRLMFTSVR